MDKKITSIINCVESEYSKYDSTQYEHIGDLILLIKIIETEGDHFVPVLGGQFKPVLGGQFAWIFH
jgi:hypothetical protein